MFKDEAKLNKLKAKEEYLAYYYRINPAFINLLKSFRNYQDGIN